jgi:hypothetical protein
MSWRFLNRSWVPCKDEKSNPPRVPRDVEGGDAYDAVGAELVAVVNKAGYSLIADAGFSKAPRKVSAELAVSGTSANVIVGGFASSLSIYS